MIKMAVLIRKAVFHHESKYVATLPCRYRMPCAYFSFFIYAGKTMPSALACYGGLLGTMWTQELSEA